MPDTLASRSIARSLDREKIVAGPRFNRWLVPPAALAIHLSIGMAYGFSVFWLPMTRLLPAANQRFCPAPDVTTEAFSTACNWTVPAVTHTFELFIAVLGLAAALWGGWLEHAGPRRAGFIAALCWGGGLMLGGLGVAVHQLWLVWLGCGVLGGIGQGLGYISPVSTLIKWFPDRRGMATGFAIMGYGGGAMIGAPLALFLMKTFGHGDSAHGVAATLVALGVIYFCAMATGAFAIRVPPADWSPAGWSPTSGGARRSMITDRHVHLAVAWRTPQFWLIWAALCLNVTAGIGVISMASPMLQEVFGGRLIGLASVGPLTAGQRAAVVASAAGLVGLISLFNSLGRLFWASISDKIGRKFTYGTFFVLGMVIYLAMPTLGHQGRAGMFVIAICLLLTMYGGGFSTVPAYLADLFGTQMVGAIHGRLLTAWSVAGIAGPFLIAALRQTQIDAGVARTLVYDRTLYILSGLLLLGLICNALVRPVRDPLYMNAEQLAREKSLQHEDRTSGDAVHAARGRFGVSGLVAWAAIGIPFLIGVALALQKAAALF